MASSGRQYAHSKIYDSSDVKRYSQNFEDPKYKAFLCPTMDQYLKSQIPGKKVLDVACGSGIWSYKAAQSGAKSVDGFDIQEEMVKLAKQATSQFNTVNIRVGDVMDMPYDDNTFDVALSFYVTSTLRHEACIKLFKEIHRVLVPGGKAVVNCASKSTFEKLYLRIRSETDHDPVLVEKEIAKILMLLSAYPSQDEINNAFQDICDVVHVSFTHDENGRLHRITDADKLTNGQAVWSKTEIMVFPGYFYNEQFFQQQIEAAGLKLEKIENYYTEERRIAFNNTNPELKLAKVITDYPIFVMYHLSKPIG